MDKLENVHNGKLKIIWWKFLWPFSSTHNSSILIPADSSYCDYTVIISKLVSFLLGIQDSKKFENHFYISDL